MNPDHALLLSWTPGDERPFSANPLAIALALLIVALDRRRGTIDLAGQYDERPDEPQMVVVATMLDFALTFAAMSTLEAGQIVATSTLRIESVSPATAGRLLARGRLEAINATTAFARGSLHQDGRIVALASATLRRPGGSAT
jgi:acyl-coenzyme A thioesterase PaaI-like protein